MTDDQEAILNYVADGAEKGGAALVTLVEIRGGASRSLGAQMAVLADGSYCGYLSGGCAEAAVAAEALEALRGGSDRCLRLGQGSGIFDIVLPCGGGITLAIHVVRDTKPLRQVLSGLGRRRRIALGYDPDAQSIAAVKAPDGGGAGWMEKSFVRSYRPNLRLILCGRGIELEAATRLAVASELQVFSFDERSQRPEFDEGDIDPDTAVVVLFHDLDHERPWLEAALKRKAFYIGALGSRETHKRRCSELWASGFTRVQTDRIKAPIGIFGPARDARALALSAIADVVSVYSTSAW
ncbi:xanthine dehydrogenase accessory factor [Rhizobium sp. BK060]|nr:xanthine dehydrogenase accessory factor [Rhizobium sp. BK060]